MAGLLSTKLSWELANPLWAASLNPILAKPQTSGHTIMSFHLVTGINIIPHKLDRLMQGWVITDINDAITYYRSAPFNNLTLTLTCSGPAIVNIEVF